MRLLQSPFDFEYLIQIFTLLVEAVTALESDARSSVTTEKFARLMAGGGDSAHPSPRASSGGGVEESENVQVGGGIKENLILSNTDRTLKRGCYFGLLFRLAGRFDFLFSLDLIPRFARP